MTALEAVIGFIFAVLFVGGLFALAKFLTDRMDDDDSGYA